MKKIVFFAIALFLICSIAYAVPPFQITNDDGSVPVTITSSGSITTQFPSDSSNAKSIEITLSATPGTLTTVTVPDAAIGFRLYPRTNHIRFAVNASAAAVATVATDDQTVAAADLAVGGIAKNDMWETRILPAGTSRTLTIRSITASVVVDLEVF